MKNFFKKIWNSKLPLTSIVLSILFLWAIFSNKVLEYIIAASAYALLLYIINSLKQNFSEKSIGVYVEIIWTDDAGKSYTYFDYTGAVVHFYQDPVYIQGTVLDNSIKKFLEKYKPAGYDIKELKFFK